MDNSLMQKINEKYEHLYKVFSSQRFLKMEGLNEVPFFISTFPPEAQNYVDKTISALIGRLATQGIDVVTINLYDLSLEILARKGKMDLILKKEQEMSKDKFLKGIQSLLDLEKTFVPTIEEKVKGKHYHMVFITGVGLVYPYIRTHNILNNLQRVFKTRPLVLFF
nr:DUF1788 domain-containing protein [Synergistales bacterium]